MSLADYKAMTREIEELKQLNDEFNDALTKASSGETVYISGHFGFLKTIRAVSIINGDKATSEFKSRIHELEVEIATLKEIIAKDR